MFIINWNVTFTTEGKTYELGLIDSIDILKSSENLADTATITLPESVLNTPFNLESKIKRGSSVEIKLGYDTDPKDLKTEFVGFVREITTNGDLKIECEDALFLFRTSIPNKAFKSTTTKQLLEHLCQEVGGNFKVECDYSVTYTKFTIHQATAYDVLKKLIEETKANIYFDSKAKVLHMHPPYSERNGRVNYSLQKNVEASNLEYKKAEDRKLEITVECINKDGTKETFKTGTTGGDSLTLKVGAMATSDLKKIAEAELKRQGGDKYEGSIDTWLIPYVEPTFTAHIEDKDYPEKTGNYYVSSVKTSISSSGGKRMVHLSLKLS